MAGARGCLTIAILLTSAAGVGAADYAALATEAAAQFAPLDEGAFANAKSQLAEQATSVERLLDPASANGAAWLEYLKWDGVRSQLAPEAAPDFEAINATRRRLSSGADGLERPELQAFAAALDQYAGVARFALAPGDRQQRSFAAAADGVAKLLDAGVADARASFQAERRLALLAGIEASGNGAQLLAEIRAEHGAPNLLIDASTPLLDRLLGRSVDDCAPVTDCILGTSISGTGATSGRIRVQTLPDAGQARLLFLLSGTTNSRTVGLNGPAVIRSTGVTHFTASKSVTLADAAFRMGPATADATTRSTTQSVSKRGGGIGSQLVAKIGAKRVAQQKSKADAIASDHAEERIAASLDERLADAIRDARNRYDDRLRKPLRRRLATPRELLMATTSDALSVAATLGDAAQLTAPADGALAPTGGDLRMRLHQSAVNNLLDAYLGGATIRRDSVEEPARLDVAAPPWLKLKAEAPAPNEEFRAWALRLRDPRPVSVEFAEGVITAILHAAEFRVEEKSYEGWDLIVRFRPERQEAGWRLVRQGPIEVLPTRFNPSRPRRLTSGEVGLRNNLAKALNEPEDRLPLVVGIDPIDLTDRDAPIDFLSMVDLVIEGGWLSTGWVAP